MADQSQRGGASQRSVTYGQRIKQLFTPAQRRLASSSGSERGSDADNQSEENEEGGSQQDAPEAQGDVPLNCHVCSELVDKKRSYATCHGCLSSVHKGCRETILLADSFHLKLCKHCGKWLTDHIDAVKQECVEHRKLWDEKGWLSKLFKTKEGMVFSNSESQKLMRSKVFSREP